VANWFEVRVRFQVVGVRISARHRLFEQLERLLLLLLLLFNVSFVGGDQRVGASQVVKGDVVLGEVTEDLLEALLGGDRVLLEEELVPSLMESMREKVAISFVRSDVLSAETTWGLLVIVRRTPAMLKVLKWASKGTLLCGLRFSFFFLICSRGFAVLLIVVVLERKGDELDPVGQLGEEALDVGAVEDLLENRFDPFEGNRPILLTILSIEELFKDAIER